MRLIGIDPSITGTGITTLDAPDHRGLASTVISSAQGVALVRAVTIAGGPLTTVTTKEGGRRKITRPLFHRLEGLRLGIGRELERVVAPAVGETVIVLEDPTDFAVRGSARSAHSLHLVGAAFGLALAVAAEILDAVGNAGTRLVAVPTRTWLPRAAGGVRFKKHALVVGDLRRLYPFTAELGDDEVMAAGVALWWYRHPAWSPTVVTR